MTPPRSMNIPNINERTFSRSPSGSIIAEYMPVVLVLFFALFFPFLNLATSLLRYSIVLAATHEAANTAAHASFFLDNSQAASGKPASLQLARDTATNFINTLNGLTPNAIVVQPSDIKTRIIRILKRPPYTKDVLPFGQALATPADTDQFIYCIEVSITASINPLMRMEGPFMLHVPGLTSPIVATITAREFAENTQGLNQ